MVRDVLVFIFAMIRELSVASLGASQLLIKRMSILPNLLAVSNVGLLDKQVDIPDHLSQTSMLDNTLLLEEAI